MKLCSSAEMGKWEPMVREICVRCGQATAYDINTPIEMRRWYVEGAGQLCEECWYKLWPTTEESLSHEKSLKE